MHVNHNLWALMAKCAFNEATEAEIMQLNEYLKRDPYLQQQYDWLLQVLNREDFSNQEVDKQGLLAQELLNKSAKLENQNKKIYKKIKIRKQIMWAAASVLCASLGLLSYYFFIKKKNVGNITLHSLTEGTSHKHLATNLPDGTKVWLNSGSKLTLKNNFEGKTREVQLYGEAFFDVTKNTDKPFIVHINNIDIHVLGTAFNVKSYGEDPDIQTTLYRGIINVTKNKDKDFHPILLHPNQKLVISKNTLDTHDENGQRLHSNPSIVISTIDTTMNREQNIETAWVYGRLEFRGETLKQVTDKMARWYHAKFVFEDDNVKHLNFNGSFEKENLEQALHALQSASSFNYKIQNNEVFISSAP